MVFENIAKQTIESMARQPVKKLKFAFTLLLNKIEKLGHEIADWKEKYQKLLDEHNRLKGEKGRPDIRPGSKGDSNDGKGSGGNPGPSRERGKNKKKKNLKIHEKKVHIPRQGLSAERCTIQGKS